MFRYLKKHSIHFSRIHYVLYVVVRYSMSMVYSISDQVTDLDLKDYLCNSYIVF